jgi:hypothetical protein
MNIHFATLVTSRFWTSETLLLARTLRTFGGELASSRMTVLTPSDQRFPRKFLENLNHLSIQVAEFHLPEEAAKFPLGIIPFAAAAGEAELGNHCDLLVWLLPDTLILNPPTDFILPEDKTLAYRPVHHQNIGSAFSQPIDEFWQQIYRHTNSPEDRLFKMRTCYREEVRPYFNAGILAVRPKNNLLQKWAEEFRRIFQHPDFTPFYSNQLYAIFMHQAVLSGVILQHLSPAQLIALPESYNYPLHMHTDYPEEGKVSQLSDLVTARYESSAELPGYLEGFENRDQLQALLDQ